MLSDRTTQLQVEFFLQFLACWVTCSLSVGFWGKQHPSKQVLFLLYFPASKQMKHTCLSSGQQDGCPVPETYVHQWDFTWAYDVKIKR